MRVHDELLDADASGRATWRKGTRRSKSSLSGSGPSDFSSLCASGCSAPVQGTEASRVAKAQRLARIEIDIDMIVNAGGRVAVNNQDAARTCRGAKWQLPLLVLMSRYLARRVTEVMYAGEIAIDGLRYRPAQTAISNDDS